ncbi:hypothetical protein N7489_005056 [Penicillium chrysogenum]|uniref:uncharacterized protein n=1 Tax=Penicillium chrysogenum TaxID=5076 RepID=UPI0024DF1FD6|nr:uncharacterized protein N7489_005056 [Penicillium chrysogenum]KAJ5244960.1 hypothetical protein N7489_005056 [Penicillium chrysogenum]KAJ5849193.1 hypothetical protein N7534_007882 [Penicillium rubens]
MQPHRGYNKKAHGDGTILPQSPSTAPHQYARQASEKGGRMPVKPRSNTRSITGHPTLGSGRGESANTPNRFYLTRPAEHRRIAG